MQLTRSKSIRGALAAATCSVLAPLGNAHAASDPWDVNSAVLFYSEKDRVSVVEPAVIATQKTGEDSSITLRAVVDTMTGASPTGATPTNTTQTFTSPSGNSTHTVTTGETPVRNFSDSRVAAGIDWQSALSRLVRNTFSTNLSRESDYLSVGFNDTVSADFNDRLTTLSAGAGLTHDLVSPSNGTPVALQLLSTATSSGDSEGSSKNTGEFMVGLTQVLSRRALMQLNYSFSRSSGYLTDPYKVLSIIDPSTGSTVDYRYEKRPNSRTSHVLYWKLAYHLPEDVIHLSYRYFRDDWGVRSHTADINYRYEMGRGSYLEPHLRFYRQSAADFYRHDLLDGAALPVAASADFRLGKMTATTAGIKFGMPVGHDGEMSLRLERMVQKGDSHPADAVGIQKNYDLYPGLQATIIQLSYSTTF